MPNWKKVIVSGSDAALNSLNVTSHFTASGLIYPTVDGTSGQVILTDGNGNLSFSNIENTTISIKNVSGGTIAKGTPCYITGSGTSGNVAGVWPADASNPLRMPAGVIAGETLNNGDEGIGLINGFINGVDTSAFGAGDSIYVAAGGGYTNVRPTGSSILVQKLGNVEKSAINGSGVINGPAYYNDLPNIQSGYTWVGNSNGVAVAIATSSIQNVVSSSYALTASYTPSIAGTDNYIPRFNGSSALENSVMYDDGTNIGIGTTSPSYTLDISGQVAQISSNNSSFTAWYIGNTGTGHAQTYYDGINGDFSGLDYGFVGQNNAGYMEYYVGSLSPNPSHVFSSGNVGIGVTSPSYKLSVAAASTSDGIQISYGGASRFIFNGDGVAYWGGSSADAGQLTWDTGKAIVMGMSGQALSLGSNGTWDRMYLDTSGNVGIGTTTPSALLSGTERVIEIANSNVASLYLNSTTGRRWSVSSISDGSITFWDLTSVAERMRINSSGNVGIGTTSPTSNLQIQSNNLSAPAFAVSKSFSGGGDGTAVMHAFGYDSGIANTGIQVGVKGTGGFSATDAYPFRVFNQGTAVFDVKANNGIKFNTYGSGTFTGTATQKLAIDSSGNVIEIPIGAGPVDGSGTANYITRWVDTDTITTSSIYETGGNIGIGTTSPSYRLHVQDSSNIGTIALGNTTYPGLLYSDAGSGEFRVDNRASSGAGYITFYPNGQAGTIGTEAMRITTAGNVGIGTTTPAYKLSVVGKIALNDGGNSVFIGTNAGQSDDATANINVGIGTNALQNNITGNQNVAIGNNTLPANNQSNNTAVGSNVLQFNTTGFSNTGIGSYALNANIEGTFNTAVGTAAMITNNSGSSNTGVGSSAMRLAVSASNNVSLGSTTLYSNTHGNDNVAIGSTAGRYYGTGTSAITDTSGSIFIGRLSRANASGEVNQIVIGMNALGLGSNTVVLGNDNVTTTALKGNVGIGITNPSKRLVVAGNGTGTVLIGDATFTNYAGISLNGTLDGGNYNILSSPSDLTLFINRPSGNDIRFRENNINQVTILTGGNVGIGTTNPSQKLDVAGRALVDQFQYTKAIGYSSGDLNSLVTAGFYDGSGMSNAPNSGWFYVTVETHVGGTDWVHQTATSFGSGNTPNEVYTRVRVGGTWGAWLQVVTANGGSWNINAATATNLSTDRTNWSTNGTITAVVGQLAWKNYGNNHTIFDASNSTTPGGGATSNTNPDVAWSSTYPTLMGWNGSNTYGVRVDSARTADSTSAVSGTTNYVAKFTSGTAIGNSVIYESSSNIGIGTTTPGAKLEVNGSFRATTKSFIIDHPTKENKKLQYGVLEGPEHSVYVRGKLTNTNVIQLPDYWHALVHEDSITVNLTAIGKKQDLWVEEITDTYITVASETGDINCFYAVFAERKDVEKLVTEFDKE